MPQRRPVPPAFVSACLFALFTLLAFPVLAQDDSRNDGRSTLVFPEEMETIDDLKARHQAQLETAGEIGVEHAFSFVDRQPSSGITFRNRAVADSGRDYKAVHYDHGNGITAADVDGDGHSDLYFTTQIGGNELWRNRGNGTFENITAKAGVALEDRISVTSSFADADNDGDPDLFVTTVRMGNFFFENLGGGRFRDITEKSGLAYSGHSSGAVFFDYDNDGRLDLFLANVGTYTVDEKGPGGYYIGMSDGFTGQLYPERYEASILYRQTGDLVFEDVSKKALLQDRGWSGDAAFVDLDEDGWLDLYVFNMQGDDHFYQNVEGKFFVDKAAQTFPKTPWGSMGGKFFDWNNDGRFDLFLTDMHSDMSEDIGIEREKLKSRMQWSDQFLRDGSNNIFGNAFFENRTEKAGEEKMVEISDEIGAENYWPWGVSIDDLNADGFDDLFITSSMNYPFRYGVNSLLLNDGGERFHDAEFILGVEPRRDDRIVQPWFELDCSGPDKEHKHCEGREGSLTVLAALGTRSAVIFDLEGDGDLDVVTNDFHSQPLVLISDLAQRHEKTRFLKVALEGKRSNRDGLGAVVRVVSDKAELTKLMDGKSGYLSQSSLPLYFGLTGAEKIERVEVKWPSGATQTVPAPAFNTLLTVEEPAEEESAAP